MSNIILVIRETGKNTQGLLLSKCIISVIGVFPYFMEMSSRNTKNTKDILVSLSPFLCPSKTKRAERISKTGS